MFIHSSEVYQCSSYLLRCHTNTLKTTAMHTIHLFFSLLFTVEKLDDGCRVTAKCYHSQDKNAAPHDMKVQITKDSVFKNGTCSCKVGLSGHCGHLCGLLYQIADFKLRGVKALPTDVAKTSVKMTFHDPRGPSIPGRRIDEVSLKGHGKSSPNPATSTGSRDVKSTLFNATCIRGPIPSLIALKESLEQDYPNLPIVHALKSSDSVPKTIATQFGTAAKGSVLSVQQRLHKDYSINIFDNIGFPDLPFRNVMINEYSTVLNQSKTIDTESIAMNLEESIKFQDLTTNQSSNPLWFKIRFNRLTASKIGSIRSRKDNFEKLVSDFKCSRHVTTSAMQRGIECEPLAAASYVEIKNNNVNLYPCGVVVSPFCPWLAASPDRKVYDPTRNEPFGLLEIKCPNVSSVLEIKDGSLKRNKDSGLLALNHNHKYYHQIQMQLAVTGLPWCDLFVWAENDNDHHLETIRFDPDSWQQTKNKADCFYFDYFL